MHLCRMAPGSHAPEHKAAHAGVEGGFRRVPALRVAVRSDRRPRRPGGRAVAAGGVSSTAHASRVVGALGSVR